MALTIITGPKVANWVARRIKGMSSGEEFGPGEYTAIGFLKDKKAVGGIVFNMYRKMAEGKHDVVLHIAVDRKDAVSRETLRYVFNYAFETCSCERVTVVIREGNTKSIEFCTRLGFRKEGVMRRGYDGKSNAIVMGMLKQECRWI